MCLYIWVGRKMTSPIVEVRLLLWISDVRYVSIWGLWLELILNAFDITGWQVATEYMQNGEDANYCVSRAKTHSSPSSVSVLQF